MIEEFYVGFHRPYLRREGRLTLTGIFGHCEIWGYTADGTWFFMDPQALGSRVRVEHRLDEVERHIGFRVQVCDTILRIPADDPEFSFPIFGMMTCASICGHMTGVRALLPAALKRRLLAKGAEVVHETAEGRSRGQEGEAPGTAPERT